MKIKVLILGGTGMLGYSLFTQYAQCHDWDVYATIRGTDVPGKWFSPQIRKKVLTSVDAENFDTIISTLTSVKPDVVINCIAWLKESQILKNPLSAININAQLPHKLALLCQKEGIRLVHIGSDAVFDGKKGMYVEQDKVNISDIYGMTKYLGEVSYPNCVTLRTSIIGHQLVERTGLVEWFLSQDAKVRGYTKVIYSGFPTTELARIIRDFILPDKSLSGIYHVASRPISKYDLLRMIAGRYGKKIEIEPCHEPVVNRALDPSLFQSLTGYAAPSWNELVNNLYMDYDKNLKLIR